MKITTQFNHQLIDTDMFKKIITIFVAASLPILGLAQTFNGVGNLPIPPGAPAFGDGVTESICNVSGVGVLGGCNVIENVTIDILYPWLSDLGIFLIGPGGQVLELSTGNGNAQDNYTNTVFSDNAATFITSGTPPYTGDFRPEGRITNLGVPWSNLPALGTFTFANTFNGTNADGNWTLYINDYVPIDFGTLVSWSITFSSNGAAPIADAGPDASICQGASATLTASGGANYSWSNGANTATTTVTPTMTTTYTVTVTNPGCGSSTDQVTITVQPRPAVTFSAANTTVCPGECQTITVNLSGTAPFSLTYLEVSTGGSVTVSFPGNTGTFQACTPSNAPIGPFLINATSLTDAFCTCTN